MDTNRETKTDRELETDKKQAHDDGRISYVNSIIIVRFFNIYLEELKRLLAVQVVLMPEGVDALHQATLRHHRLNEGKDIVNVKISLTSVDEERRVSGRQTVILLKKLKVTKINTSKSSN